MKSRFKMKIEKRVCVLVVSRNNIHWKVPPFNFFILLSLPSLISLKLRPLKSCKMGLCSSSLELLRSPLIGAVEEFEKKLSLESPSSLF
ncbi:hypothetical protein JHK87_009723 [Glycine soja]|nr:hypothetical protein JHK87_009723 [Glycine soja]